LVGGEKGLKFRSADCHQHLVIAKEFEELDVAFPRFVAFDGLQFWSDVFELWV